MVLLVSVLHDLLYVLARATDKPMLTWKNKELFIYQSTVL